LAFGIIVVNVIRGLGIKDQKDIARNTVKAGILSCGLMAVIYLLVALTGTYSLAYLPIQENGSQVLSGSIAHFFGSTGQILMALIVGFACLKTVIGLITSCASSFHEMFPKRLSYRGWVFVFCAVTFSVANLGLNSIIQISIPVLTMLYPIAIMLTLLAICGKYYHKDPAIIRFTMTFAIISSTFDLIHALPSEWIEMAHLEGILHLLERYLPFYQLGFGWILPTAIGLIIGCFVKRLHPALTGKRSRNQTAKIEVSAGVPELRKS
jgi:LIVCS family branched-chain amino acid:cation transporter